MSTAEVLFEGKMATAHKRTSFLQFLNKHHDDTFHSMMESCASFDTLTVPSIEGNSDEKPARKTISGRMSQFKKKLSTTPTKKRESFSDTDVPPPLESDCEVTTRSGDSKQTGRRKSKSPAARRWTGETENDSLLESGDSDIDDGVDDVTIEGVSVVSGEKLAASTSHCISVADDSTKRKRRSFFSAFSLPGHSHKTLEPQFSTKKLDDEANQLNESQSSKLHSNTNTKLIEITKLEDEADRLNEKQSSQTHASPITKLLGRKKLEDEADQTGEKQASKSHGIRSSKLVGSKKLESKADRSNESPRAKLHGSQFSTLNRSQELDGKTDLLNESRSSRQYSSRSFKPNQSKELDVSKSSTKLNESRRPLRIVDSDASESDRDARPSPMRSPRSRIRSDSEGRNGAQSTRETHGLSDGRKSRRSLSPRRRLKQSTPGESDEGGAIEAGLSRAMGGSAREKGESPRRRNLSQNLPSLQTSSNVDSYSKISAIGSGDEKVTRRAAANPGHRRRACDSNASEQNERLIQNETTKLLRARKRTETSLKKILLENDGCESNRTDEFDFGGRKVRQEPGKSPRRSRSVSAVARTRHGSKPRDASLNPNKQKNGNMREGTSEDGRSCPVNRIQDLRSKIEQSSCSEKRTRSSSQSMGPGRELSLKNMLDAAAPSADRKCLTVVSPKDYEKKKKSSAGNGEIIDVERQAPSPSTSAERLKDPVQRALPKKSPSSHQRSTIILETLKVSPKKSLTSNAQASMKVAAKKPPSSSRTLATAPDQSPNVIEAEGEKTLERDARGRARSRVEQLKRENCDSQRPRSRSSSRNRDVDTNIVSCKGQAAEEKLSESLSKSPGVINQRLRKSPGTSLRIVRPSSPAKLSRAPIATGSDSQRDATPGKSQKQTVAERQEDSKSSLKTIPSPVSGKSVALESQAKISTPSRYEINEARRRRRSPSKSPGRETTQQHGQRNGKPVSGDLTIISKRNEQIIRKAMSARNIDGHQSHDFQVEEVTASGTVVRRKLKVVPAGDVETLGSMLLHTHKDSKRDRLKRKSGPVISIAAQLYIPDMDESQKSNLKVEYTEYNDISMLDNYVDDGEESEEKR